MLFFNRCKHRNIRCLHGDEVWNTMRAWRRPEIARTRCVDCGKALYNVELPDICTVTNTEHDPWRRNDDSSLEELLRWKGEINEGGRSATTGGEIS